MEVQLWFAAVKNLKLNYYPLLPFKKNVSPWFGVFKIIKERFVQETFATKWTFTLIIFNTLSPKFNNKLIMSTN